MSDAGLDAEWRRLVFPAGYRNPTPAARYNLVVIGAGPAGLVTSIVAAGLGARVALVERHAMGGDCLNVGCVPSKTLLAAASSGLGFDEAMQRVRAVRARIARHDSVERYVQAGVDVFLGTARFLGPREVAVGDAVLRTRKTVVATGARPLLPAIAGLAAAAPLTNETVFALERQPARLVVLGGGPIGCELAQAFARLGTRVELLEQQPRLLPAEDAEAGERIAASLAADGVRLHLGARVASVARAPQGTCLETSSGPIATDAVLVAAGRVRNVDGLDLERAGVRYDAREGIRVDARLRTTQRHVYAAGDVCSALQFTHQADAHARAVVRNALFLGRARVDRLAVPVCTYTRPEVARAGATRAALESAGQRFDSYRCEFGDLDRGRTDDAADGYVEVRTAPGSDRILGATLVGRDAGEQIAPLLLLMSAGRGLGSLGSLVLPYPTRSEYLRRIADAYARTRLTLRAASTLRWWLQRTR